jgi:hypothetical protein
MVSRQAVRTITASIAAATNLPGDAEAGRWYWVGVKKPGR